MISFQQEELTVLNKFENVDTSHIESTMHKSVLAKLSTNKSGFTY
jgi:hypothetical protein